MRPAPTYIMGIVAAALGYATPLRVMGEEFDVADGDAAGLISAIRTANGNGEANAINLAVAGSYTLISPDNFWYGPNGLPAISGNITIVL